MITSLKPYPEYQESGSRWLAGVPSHWNVRNLRTLIRTRNERNRADLPLLSVAREKGVFVRSLTDADENHNVIPEDLSNYKVARAGNLVINKMKAWQGSMGIAPCDGIVSPAYFVFDFAIDNSAFGQALLRSKPYVAHFGQASDGVRVGQWDLTIAGMRQIPVLLPPPSEQAAIVRFLDWANGRLERAIRAKRKIITLLNEQKQAIIHQAVTRGLDPSVRLKPSGIPWLGEIPEHWEVRRAKFLLTEVDVRSTTGDEQLLSVSQYSGVTPKVSDDRVGMRRAETLIGYKVVLSGQLVVNIMIAWNGSLAITEYEGLVSPAYCVFSMAEAVHPWYVHHLLRTKLYGARIKQGSTGVIESRLRLYPDALGRIELLLPPTDEQIAIANHISTETADLDRIASRLEREITLLREYRTRLVADVVTGKLDVREAAERLPAEEAIDTSEDAAEFIDEVETVDEEITE